MNFNKIRRRCRFKFKKFGYINPTTTLNFTLPIEVELTITIYNLQGREVISLIDGNMHAGYHSVVWNADDHSSGLYIVKMLASDHVSTQKLLLVK